MSFAKSKEGRLLKPGLTSVGYPSVVLGRNNTKMVHSLVAEAFIGKRPAGFDVCHKDGNKENNCVTNLMYASRATNNHQASFHGKRKMKYCDVLYVRDNPHLTLDYLAKKFNVSIYCVWAIRKKRLWNYDVDRLFL